MNLSIAGTLAAGPFVGLWAQAEPAFPLTLIRPEVLPFVVGTIAILAGTVYALVQLLLHHRERMAMIRSGMHPDAPPPAADSAAAPTTAPAKAAMAASDEAEWQSWK